jgi:hypothetical protein
LVTAAGAKVRQIVNLRGADSIVAPHSRALSAHKSKAYEGYAKRTMQRALAATRKRHAHRLAANAPGTEFPNGRQIPFPNENLDKDSTAK